MAVASAGRYANNLHLALDRQLQQHLIIQFLQVGCSSWRPTNSVKAPQDLGNVCLNDLADLFLAEVDGKRQLEGAEHRRKVLGLGVVHELSQSIIHDRVKERQVVPADLAAQQVLEHVAVQVQRADFVLQETQTDHPETTHYIITIIIKDIYIAQVHKGHKCSVWAEMAVWLCNCLCLYSYLHNCQDS